MIEETTVFRGSPSLLTRIIPMFLACLVLGGAITGLVLLTNPAVAVQWGLWGLAAAAVIYLVAEVVIHNATAYEITSERIRVSHGILTRRTDELELYRAGDTTLIEPLAQRIVGLGTIEIRTLEEGNPILRLEAVHGARKLRETLRTHIELCRDRKRVRLTELDSPITDLH